MKRSYEFHEKINTKWNKKCYSSLEQDSPCSDSTQNGIDPGLSRSLDYHQLNQDDSRNKIESRLLEDSFRSRITSKLRSVLDGFASQLQSISKGQQSDVAFEDKLALQNFLHSAKSQISGLLSQKPGRVSKEHSSPKTSLKSFNVDPLQIQISLKLQDLLCKALDDRLCCKNVTNANSNEEAEWRNLSHLLQDFLSSAKKKISFSLASDKNSAVKSACAKRNLFCDTNKKYPQTKNKVQKQAPKSAIPLPMMECLDESNSSHSSQSGILLLGDSEQTPDYLDLSLEVEDSDVDDPGLKNDEPDSDEEVVVLGEKKPTYQEITLDEEGEVYEKVVELKKKVRIPKDLEDLLYDCPKCDKKFRVESLLKFHIRMHSVVESHGRVATPTASVSNQTENTPRMSKSRKEKENKLNSKSSHQHKIQKHGTRRKVKITS